MSDTANNIEQSSSNSLGEFHGSILVDPKKLNTFQPNCVVYIKGEKYRLCKVNQQRSKILIFKQKIKERLKGLKKQAQTEFQHLQIKGSNQNIISMKVPILGRDSDIKKIANQPAMLISTKCNEVSNKRSKRIRSILNGMRSISPKRIPAPLKLLSGPINACQERVRMKSPASRRTKYILNEQTETYAIPQIAQKDVFRIKDKESKTQGHLQDPRTLQRTYKTEENSTESQLSPFNTTRKLRAVSGLPSTFSKKFQSIKGVQKAKLNIFNSETLSPRIGKRSQRPKQDLSSILSHKEIIVMRAKIMNDFTSLL
ncbi:unnamed protein product [Moneuplotes crassus]|uniref:Uncharacterized protein n=1 Tax=Euplotes crassus TaxID=5936 RepID=A0AAD2DB30_EUPCR|nr:unnamed protein product [Moneuplotes crassus]